jgi:hypothetical protein
MSLMGLNSLHSLNSLIASYVDNLALSSWNTAWEEARVEGVAPPMAPPLYLIWSVSLVKLLVFLLILPVHLLMFWDWIACELLTLYS